MVERADWRSRALCLCLRLGSKQTRMKAGLCRRDDPTTGVSYVLLVFLRRCLCVHPVQLAVGISRGGFRRISAQIKI